MVYRARWPRPRAAKDRLPFAPVERAALWAAASAASLGILPAWWLWARTVVALGRLADRLATRLYEARTCRSCRLGETVLTARRQAAARRRLCAKDCAVQSSAHNPHPPRL